MWGYVGCEVVVIKAALGVVVSVQLSTCSRASQKQIGHNQITGIDIPLLRLCYGNPNSLAPHTISIHFKYWYIIRIRSRLEFRNRLQGYSLHFLFINSLSSYFATDFWWKIPYHNCEEHDMVDGLMKSSLTWHWNINKSNWNITPYSSR